MCASNHRQLELLAGLRRRPSTVHEQRFDRVRMDGGAAETPGALDHEHVVKHQFIRAGCA